jgi:hypothetical protein
VPESVVLTCLLTAERDPQRGRRWKADSGLLTTLRESVTRHDRHLVVLHDKLTDRDGGLTTFTPVPPGGNPYWVRWVHYRNWLERHPEVQWVWCVDGTDVEMLHDPFGRMSPDRLYVGSEEETIGGWHGGPWLAKGANPATQAWLADHPDMPILNMGVLGGHRDVMLEATGALAARAGESAWEIGAFQQIAAEMFADRVVTGPQVHSVFHANDRTADAWWRHK